MKMTSIMLVLALVFACLFSVMIISHAANASDVTDATFADVIMNVGKDETERNLTWYSNYNTNGEVQYAKAENMTGNSFPATYSTATARVAATNEKGSYAYKATIKNLEADTRYAYRLVTGATVSDVRYFDVKDFDDSFSFIYISDPQVGSSTYKAAWIDTLDKISESFGEASFIVSGGDQISSPTAEGDYDNFIVDGVSEIAIAPTNGPGHDNTALYTDHYNLPNLSTTYGVSTATSDYYYTYNNALFVHLNMDVRTVSEHLTFIENAIKNSPEALWHIVVIHWSFYSGSTESQNATIVSAAENMVGRMNELGVDLVLSGHDHFYARSQLVTDYRTVSDDVVVDNTVTNPKGTLYVCGSSATGNGITAPVSSEYSAYQSSVNRKSIINITVNEESLSLNAYFVDGATPELFDSFTINRTSPKVRVGFDDGMLKLKVGDEYISLVDAYRYTAATVKVIDGYWSISENGGASFTSLGIAATSSYENSVSLKINESTGYWQLSENGGASYTDLPINVKRYTVTYVTDKEPYPDLSVYSTSTYVEGMLPDPPAIVLPAGSFDEGVFYEWSWEFKNSDGTSATSFTAGSEYVAYVTAEITSMPSELYIGKTTNESEGVYTWADAWAIAIKFPDEKFTFVLNENVSVSATTTLTSKTDVTVDLAGYTLTTTSSYAINYNTGSTGSSFALISSKAGGTVNSKSFVCLTTSQASNVNVSYGSDDGYPITLNANDSTYGYLLFAGGNFKRGSTVNFSIKNGTYTATNGIIYVDNATDDLSAANHYKINISGSDITLGKSPICFKGARKASASSFMNVTDSSISISSGTAPVIASDQWYGSFSFTGCDINGVTFPESGITNITGATFGDGTTFTNSDETFNSDKTAFASAKLSLNANCSIRNNGGTLEIYKGEKLPDNVLLISKTSNNAESLYTWNEAWNKAMANPSVSYIFRLTENTNLGGSQLIEIKAKCNVTVDLAGYAIKVSTNSNYLVAYGNGSTGSSFSLISSAEGGSYYGPTLVLASSSGASSLTFNIGIADSYPITVTTFKTASPYSSKGSLLGVNGNFKNGSTLTATVTNGTYVLEGEILSTNNYSGNLNTFKINISGADITVGTAVISFASTHNTTATSYFNVENATISSNADTLSFTGANQWYGSLEFANCKFNGIVFDAAMLSNISGGIFKSGCSFTNYGDSFNSEFSAFACDKLACESGFTLIVDANGTVTIDEVCPHHTKVTIIGKAPTCTNTGLTDGVKCANCGDIITAQETIPALGHNYNAVVTDPDCVNGGYTTYTCSVCGDSYIGNSVSATGHTSEIIPGKAPTCTDTGLTDGAKCSTCGDILTAQTEIPANGHTDDNNNYICDVCYEDLCTNHNETSIEGKAPTCTNTGLTDGVKCANCGDIIVAQETIPALGHSYNEVVTDPDCTNAGYTTYTCSICGDTYVADEVQALGHDYEAVVTAPDCVNGGYTTYTCSVCGNSYIADEVQALGHNYEAAVTAPDCVNGGYTTYTCSGCANTYVADEKNALGHSYNAVITAPTCTNAGYTTYTCSGCADTYVADEVAALGHSYESVTTNPTCTEEGYTTYTCNVCNDAYVTDKVAANEHEWKAATTESPKTCEKCGETEGEKLPILESETNHDECEENANGWSKFWTAICNFFRRIFGLKEQCYCGKELDL